MKIRLKTNLALLILLSTSWAFGATGGSSRLEESLENRLLPLIQHFDKDAFVIVRASPLSKSTPMAMTPFELRDMSVEGTSGDPAIRRVDVYVLTSARELPHDLSDAIRRICSGPDEKTPVNIKIEPFTVPAMTSNSWIVTFMSNWGAISLGLLTLIIFASLVGYLGLRISKGLQSIGEMGSRSGAPSYDAQAMNARINQLTAQSGHNSESNQESVAVALGRFPLESCIAILTDCYWGQFDGYASFIWARLPFPMRKVMMEKANWLEDYTSYLAGYPEQDMHCLHDPAYITPMPFFRNDNAGITSLVRQYPILLNRLSNLRTAGLDLSLREKVEMFRLAKTQRDAPMPKFQPLAPSPRRIFGVRFGSVARLDVKDERELLQMKDLELEFVERIPSLGWLLRLSRKDVERILTRIPAKDLAAAWVGPPEILKRIGQCLPEKKRELLASYLGRVPARRDSPTFLQIHAATINALRNPASEEVSELGNDDEQPSLDFAA